MSDYTLFFNPMSRALIAKWAFAEAGVTPQLTMVEWDNKPPALTKVNPLGKLPTIIHHSDSGSHVVSEAAAVCHYLAEMEAPALLPRADEKADYFRWMFFSAGPLESAIASKNLGWEPEDAKQEMTVGFGSFDRTVDALEEWFARHSFVCGDRFTMADVYVGSQVDWGLRFGTIPDRDSLRQYQQRLQARDAYKASMGDLPG